MIKSPSSVYYDSNGSFADVALQYCFNTMCHIGYMDDYILLKLYCGISKKPFCWRITTSKEEQLYNRTQAEYNRFS